MLRGPQFARVDPAGRRARRPGRRQRPGCLFSRKIDTWPIGPVGPDGGFYAALEIGGNLLPRMRRRPDGWWSACFTLEAPLHLACLELHGGCSTMSSARCETTTVDATAAHRDDDAPARRRCGRNCPRTTSSRSSIMQSCLFIFFSRDRPTFNLHTTGSDIG
jgi:hypothetical protein